MIGKFVIYDFRFKICDLSIAESLLLTA